MAREDIRAEMFEAIEDMLEPVLTQQSDKEEIHTLLVNLQEVEMETDEYTNRLEMNLACIREEEEGQVDTMLIQQGQMSEVMNRLDSVNAGLSDNLHRMRDMTGNGAAVFRLVIATGFGICIIFAAFFLSKT